jgi:adenosylmethionine-8-amino-7-oxononanoate aminotransferase
MGLMVGIELVADKANRRPFPRSARVAERVQAEALAAGVNVYIGTGMADGVNGDAVLVGPPFIVSAVQLDEIVAALRGAIARITD